MALRTIYGERVNLPGAKSGREKRRNLRRVLDLFCGAGGAAMGLHRVWSEAEIIGVDIRPQPRYPFTFIKADAMTFSLDGFDFIWASPPCQGYSKTRKIMEGKGIPNPRAHNLIPEVRERLVLSGVPWVIENVPGAPLRDPVTLCGTMFGLRVLRHRRFESSFQIPQPQCRKHGGTNSHRGYSTGAEFVTVGGHNFRRVEGAAAMDIDWMANRAELSEAIPPAYSEFIARQLT
jgi:DNA (cytosine-5)-methyltransferase 1